MVGRYVGDLIDQQAEAARLAAVPNTLPDTGTALPAEYKNRDELLKLIQQSNVPQKKVEMNTGLLSGDQKGFMDVLKSPDQAQLSALIGLGAGFLNPKNGQPALTGTVNALKAFGGARERDYEREVDTEERAQSDLSRRLQAAVGYDTIERRDQNQANLEAGIVREDAYRSNVAQQADVRSAKSMYTNLLQNYYTPAEARVAVEELYPGMLPEGVGALANPNTPGTGTDTGANAGANAGANTPTTPTVNDLTGANERAVKLEPNLEMSSPASGGGLTTVPKFLEKTIESLNAGTYKQDIDAKRTAQKSQNKADHDARLAYLDKKHPWVAKLSKAMRQKISSIDANGYPVFEGDK